MSPQNSVRSQLWVPPLLDSDELLAEISAGPPSPSLAANRAVDVGARSFLEIKARVSGLNGEPAIGVPVVFEWKTKDRYQRFTRFADIEGNASVRRWIRGSEKAQPAVVIVTAESSNWRARRYAWYIAQ